MATEFNQIPLNPGNWGDVAGLLNENSNKIAAEFTKVENATTKFKGFFTSLAQLKAVWPSPLVGDTAWVGTTYPGTVHDVVNGEWHDTTVAPPSNSVNLAEYSRIASNEDFTGIKKMSRGLELKKGFVAYGQDSFLTGVGRYVAAYVSPIYGTRVLSYDGVKYYDLILGSYVDGKFSMTLKENGEVAFGHLKQETGDDPEQVMSQDAVSKEFASVRSDLSEKASKNNLKYLVLSYNTDAATTRKLVLSTYRCSGLVISYNTGSKWVTELYTGTSFADADWASDSNWKIVGAGENLTIEGLNLYELQAPNGAVIMSFDENGRLYSKYVPDSIPIEAVNGLDNNLNRLNEVSLSKESNSNIFEVKDDLGNIFAFIDADGIFDIPRLRVNNFDFQGEQFDDTSFVKDTTVVFPELKFFKINIEGQLAWDSYNLTSVDNVATFYTADNKPLAKFKTKHSIQGATSAGGHPKKGYTLDLFNNDWNPVELKIGNMISVDSYHTKGFWGDCTHTRDVGNGRFYWEIAKTRKYPNNLIRNVITTIPTAFNNKTSAVEDATFSSNGIPFAMYHHGVFFGLYTFRLKKTRLNYALNNKNENHIFIDSLMAGVGLGNQNYADFDEIATKYEIRSPKNITTKVRTNVERFFSYMKEVFDGTKDLATTYQDYIILDAWIDWKIQAEIIGHWDSVTNNAAYITYDGLKWWPVMADTDNTLGLMAYSTPITTSTEIYIYNDIWKKFNATFLPQIKARYKELRDNGVISDASAKKIFGGISENIPYYVYEQDFAKWGSWSGSPIIMDSLYTFYHNRMNYLDSIWMD